MHESVATLALAGGLAWASGLRLYAVAFLVGLAGRMGWLPLPGQLDLLQHDWVLGASGLMLVGEFIADKIPAFDSLWDALHTFVRGPGGAAMAYLVVGEQASPAAHAAIALMGGSIATATHLTKAGTRVLINHSPEPFSNWAASATEDVASVGLVWLAWQHPVLLVTLLLLFIGVMIWALPKLWGVLRGLQRRLLRSSTANP